jgi:hypothetical protein
MINLRMAKAPIPEVSGEPPPKAPLEETLDWLRCEVWFLPVLDQRGDVEILGYNAHGCFD